jgi:hypothetical protein
MKSFNALSQIHSFQEQLADAIQDKDICAQALFEGFIEQTIELYNLKTCDCGEVYEGREDFCTCCIVQAARLRASAEQDYQSRNF